MAKFGNQYKGESYRLRGWDYSSSALYFLTIVTQNRECNLGYIESDEMYLSEFGKIIEKQWYRSFEIRSELFLDEFIIMPNHIHAIVKLDNGDDLNFPVEMRGFVVETHGRASQQQPFIRKPKSISSFIAGFKSAVNSEINNYIDENELTIPIYNRNNHFFQPNYYDHIIRNKTDYNRIKNYIINNPKKWDEDRFRAK
ncbi:MAG: hypothetical protein N4A72_03945 [Bacteroidales bacterium]|jgi:REP element-mobilizing transposase RayT|nr:hypothetical protein [Bacteroidales bacterium]